MSVWYIFSLISAGVLVFSGFAWLLGSMRYKRERKLTPYQWLCIGVFLGAVILLIPIHFSLNELYDAEKSALLARGFYAFFASAQQSFRMFIMDGSVSDILAMLTELKAEYQLAVPEHAMRIYEMYGGLIYFTAPMLTFGFILSFFKNAVALLRYHRMHIFLPFVKEVHIFSELNEKSLALAKSIYNDKPKSLGARFLSLFRKRLIVFTDVLKKNEETSLDRVESAREMRAILFKNDIASIKLTYVKHHIYLIGEDEQEKVRQTETVIKKYGEKANKSLWICSEREETKCLLKSYSEEERSRIQMRIARIDDIRLLVYQHLYEKGIRLYESSYENPLGGISSANPSIKRIISVVIVGFGRYGREMMKALLWYCQFPGYTVHITAIDENADSETQFKDMCPDINTSELFEGDDDMKYRVRLVKSTQGGTNFEKEIGDVLKEEGNNLSYVFVSLGSDASNIAASINIRSALERRGCKNTIIDTVVYDSVLKEHICPKVGDKTASKDKKQSEDVLDKIISYNQRSSISSYNISIIGDMNSFYTLETFVNSKMIAEGYEVHKRWCHYYLAMDIKRQTATASESTSAENEQLDKTVLIKENTENGFTDIESAKAILNNPQSISAGKLRRTYELGYYMDDYSFYSSISKVIHYQLHKHMSESSEKTERLFPILCSAPKHSEWSANSYKIIIDNTLDAKESEKTFLAFLGALPVDLAERTLNSAEQSIKSIDASSYEIDLPSIKALQMSDRRYVELVRAAADIEHIRWNAYMRSEGFKNGPKKMKDYKLHNLLLKTGELKICDLLNDI